MIEPTSKPTPELTLDDLTDRGALQFIGWTKGTARTDRAVARMISEFLAYLAKDIAAGERSGEKAVTASALARFRPQESVRASVPAAPKFVAALV